MTEFGRLDGRVIVVTGGASGIGQATVERCALLGADVAIGDVPSSAGASVAEGLRANGYRVAFVPTDVTVEAQCSELMHAAIATFGKLDVLIACAGILEGAMVDVDELEDATFQHVMDVNVRGAFLCVKHAVRVMKASGGVIILIASGAGVTGGSSSYAYGTSKAGVHGLGKVLQSRLDPSNIRVNTVCPGSIATPLKIRNIEDVARTQRGGAAMAAQAKDKLGDPEGVARVLAFLASPDAAYVRGTIFTR